MKKNKTVPLLKISGDSSIYFDFEKNTPYVQHFIGEFTEKTGKEYSRGKTFWISQALLGGVVALSFFLDKIFTFPVLVSLLIAILSGYLLATIFVKIALTNSFGQRDYRMLTNKEIGAAISNSQNFWVLILVELFIVLSTSILTMISLMYSSLKSTNFFMISGGIFVFILIKKSIHPYQGIKARKILKKQMKEGKFHD